MSEQERLQALKNSLASPGSAMHGIIQRKMDSLADASAAQPAQGRVIGIDAYEKLLDKALALEAERDALRDALEGVWKSYIRNEGTPYEFIVTKSGADPKGPVWSAVRAALYAAQRETHG